MASSAGESTLAEAIAVRLRSSSLEMFRVVRTTVIAISFLAVVVLVPAGFVFGLNGGQWSWWRTACWVGAFGFVVTAALFPSDTNAPPHPRLRAFGATALFLGLVAIAISLTVMASQYSDPYSGSRVWPHSLAVLALAGLVVVELSLFACAGWSVRWPGRRS